MMPIVAAAIAIRKPHLCCGRFRSPLSWLDIVPPSSERGLPGVGLFLARRALDGLAVLGARLVAALPVVLRPAQRLAGGLLARRAEGRLVRHRVPTVAGRDRRRGSAGARQRRLGRGPRTRVSATSAGD